MLEKYLNHNRFKTSLADFVTQDPQLHALAKLHYQFKSHWWKSLAFNAGGIYILTGGRQVGKSTSCKLLISYVLKNKLFTQHTVFYLPCDEIFDAKELGSLLRLFFNEIDNQKFLLIIDEITYVKQWDRVIKALADEGYFTRGICVLTGSDSLILKEAAQSFPGRRGTASQTDFHLYPLSFKEYVDLKRKENANSEERLKLFEEYLLCGGYLRAINDIADHGKILDATFLTYEQWIRGDFLKKGKNEQALLSILQALLTTGVSQISYSSLNQNIGTISKETCIQYCHLLERMDILINLQAFDHNKKQGFPRKDRKFHFVDPFITRTIYRWAHRELGFSINLNESNLVEAIVASHAYRKNRIFYFKGQGEIDVIMIQDSNIKALEVKWAKQIRPADVKTLKHFSNATILRKRPITGVIDNIPSIPVYDFLYEML